MLHSNIMKEISADTGIADGLCAIEIISDIDFITDYATIGNFRRWAQAMITTCSINSEEVKGGLARNLGWFLLQSYLVSGIPLHGG